MPLYRVSLNGVARWYYMRTRFAFTSRLTLSQPGTTRQMEAVGSSRFFLDAASNTLFKLVADKYTVQRHPIKWWIRDILEKRLLGGFDALKEWRANACIRRAGLRAIECRGVGVALNPFNPLGSLLAMEHLGRGESGADYFRRQEEEARLAFLQRVCDDAVALIRHGYYHRDFHYGNLLDVIGLQPAEIRAIYNPYEREPFLRMAEEPADIPEGEYLINVGTFEARKRHDRLLRAYEASGVTTPLVLLGKGKGDEEAKLRAMIEDMGLTERVILPGYQTNPYPFIRNAKALILTSDAEGLPRALIESLLLDTPVVSVDCPSGPREILSGELADFLVPREDEAALADAIARMDAAPVTVTEAHYRPFLKETVLPQFEALAE